MLLLVAVCPVVVTITLVGVADNPPDIAVATSVDPDDSEPKYNLNPNPTGSTTQHS